MHVIHLARVFPRVLLLLFTLVLIPACGAARSPAVGTSTTAVSAESSSSAAPTSAPAPAINRGKGDPNAPVKVIEYSDFQ